MPLLSFRLQGYGWQAWPPIDLQRHEFLVDWLGDGFGDDDVVSADLIGEIHTFVGMEGEASLTMRAQPGSITATLRNVDGRYSALKTTGPHYGFIKPDIWVRVSHMTPYYGIAATCKLESLVTISADDSPNGQPCVQLKAVGILNDFGSNANQITAGPLDGVMPGDVVNAVLDVLGIAEADRNIADGSVPVANWYKENAPARETIQQMEEHDFGRFFETKAGGLKFEGRYTRLEKSVVYTFSATPGSSYPPAGAQMQDSIRRIFNRAVAKIPTYTEAAAVGVLWEAPSDEARYISPGATVTYIARYSEGYAYPWTAPLVGTDVISATGTPVVGGVVMNAQTMSFDVTNSHVSEAVTLTTLQARGIARAQGVDIEVESKDGAGPYRTFPLVSPYYPNRDYATASCAFIVLSQKDNHPLLVLTIAAQSSPLWAEAATIINVSDRLTVTVDDILTQFGYDGDAFVESIEEVFGPPGVPWLVKYKLSPAFAGLYDLDIWQLGVAGKSELGDTTIAAY